MIKTVGDAEVYAPMSTRHVLEQCVAVEATRKTEGIRSFLESCREAGLASETAFRFFISGLDSKGCPIKVCDHMLRGKSLMKLTEAWLDIWDHDE